jgi:hypothetical protein
LIPIESAICVRSLHTISSGGFLFENFPNYLVEGFWTRQHEARQELVIAIFIKPAALYVKQFKPQSPRWPTSF